MLSILISDADPASGRNFLTALRLLTARDANPEDAGRGILAEAAAQSFHPVHNGTAAA
jgi:hypothetical protein